MHKKYDAINLQIRLLDELYFVGSFTVDVIDKKCAIPGIYTVCHAKPDYPRSIWKLLVFTRYLSAFLYPPKQQVIQYRIADRNKKSGFVNFA